jgi:hypothetical protein
MARSLLNLIIALIEFILSLMESGKTDFQILQEVQDVYGIRGKIIRNIIRRLRDSR